MIQGIKNLVFKGGGVLGTAYAGALEALDENDGLNDITGVAGTSAGGLAALLFTLGYSPSEMYHLLSKVEYRKFQDQLTLIDFPKKYGIYKGDYLLEWIGDLIEEKTGDRNITFKELHNKAPMDLKIFACDLNTASPQEFSKQETPDIKIAEALRASMSIPLMFHAWRFEDGNPNDHIFVDGGVMYNFPMSAFDDHEATLGFFIKTAVDVVDLKFNEITSFVHRIFKAMLKGQDIDFLEREGHKQKVIYIDNLDIASNDFSITKEEKQSLYDVGKKSAEDYLKKIEGKQRLK